MIHFAVASCRRGGFKLSLIIKDTIIQMFPLNRLIVCVQAIVKLVVKAHGLTLLIWGDRINSDLRFVLELYYFKLQMCLEF